MVIWSERFVVLVWDMAEVYEEILEFMPRIKDLHLHLVMSISISISAVRSWKGTWNRGSSLEYKIFTVKISYSIMHKNKIEYSGVENVITYL